MGKASDKLKRLVKAQTVLENQAKGEVADLSATLVELEQRLEKTQNAFSSTSVTLLYSDFYIGHLHMLQARSVEVRQLLEIAQSKLQNETLRSDKLNRNLQSVAAEEFRRPTKKKLWSGLREACSDREPVVNWSMAFELLRA